MMRLTQHTLQLHVSIVSVSVHSWIWLLQLVSVPMWPYTLVSRYTVRTLFTSEMLRRSAIWLVRYFNSPTLKQQWNSWTQRLLEEMVPFTHCLIILHQAVTSSTVDNLHNWVTNCVCIVKSPPGMQPSQVSPISPNPMEHELFAVDRVALTYAASYKRVFDLSSDYIWLFSLALKAMWMHQQGLKDKTKVDMCQCMFAWMCMERCSLDSLQATPSLTTKVTMSSATQVSRWYKTTCKG